MQTIVDFFAPPPELLAMLGLMIGLVFAAICLAVRTAVKAATPENGRKLAVGTAKVAGKTAGKLVATAAWQAFKSRAGM